MFRKVPPRAPPAPRAITSDIEQDTAQVGRMFRLFGIIWSLIGGVGAIAAAVAAMTVPAPDAWNGAATGAITCLTGLALLFFGRKLRTDAIEVYRDGVEAEAEIVSVAIDHRVRVNKKSPWRVAYRFDANGQTHEGAYACWTDAKPEIEPGARVMALHHATRPSRSVLWTRVRPLADEPRLRVGAEASPVAELAESDEVVAEERARR